MNISRECIYCLARQAVEISEEVTDKSELQEEIIKCALKELSNLDFNKTSPEIAYKMHQHAKRLTGIDDPYKEMKDDFNKTATDIYNRIRREKWIEKSDDPFDLSCRLAIAGNIIDFSVGLDLDVSDIIKSVEDSLTHTLFGSGSTALKRASETAQNILYIADNSGEIIFDKFLLSQLPKDKVTYVVKGSPIVNDATMHDAITSGVIDMVKVIDNGHGAQGTILKDCSPEFREAFEAADLIISKGQANFETLSHRQDKDIFYLLRAKCKSVASALGCVKMDYVLTNSLNLSV